MSRRKTETLEAPEPTHEAPSNVVPIESGGDIANESETAVESDPEPEPQIEAGQPIEAAPIEAVVNWRKVTTVRTLKVDFAPSEKEAYTQELARSVDEITELEQEKKASADRYKVRIQEVESRQKRLSHLLKDGWDERPVKCEWKFQCAGRQKDGAYVFHPEKKALVRLDTGDVVEIQELNEADYNNHQELALDDAADSEAQSTEPEEVSDQTEAEEGYTVDSDAVPEDDITY